MKASKTTLLLLPFALSISSTADAATYRIYDLGTFGGSRSVASGINDSGVVVGTAYDASNGRHAFWYDGGNTLHMVSPDAQQAFGINNAGQIVGRNTGSAFIYDNGAVTTLAADTAYDINENAVAVGYARSTTNYAFSYDNGVMTNLGTLPDASTSSARAINDNGVIVGSSNSNAFIYENGQIQDLLPNISRNNFAMDINNNNQVLGYYRNLDGQWDAFITENGSMTSYDFDGANTTAYAINQQGAWVGSYQSGSMSFDTSALLMEADGTMVDLNAADILGAGFDHLTRAYDINIHGQIVGYGLINGEDHAFLLNPVPVPAAVWLFGSGLIGLMGFSRRKDRKLTKTDLS
jgi:probable HAF family extracellular repeat protein